MASLIQRGEIYYIQHSISGKARRVSLGTDIYQLAKEKLRQFESSHLRGDDNPMPTRTPIPQIVQVYVDHIRVHKTAKSAQTDVYYLREAFGPICHAVSVTSRKISAKAKRRPSWSPNVLSATGRPRGPAFSVFCLTSVCFGIWGRLRKGNDYVHQHGA